MLGRDAFIGLVDWATNTYFGLPDLAIDKCFLVDLTATVNFQRDSRGCDPFSMGRGGRPPLTTNSFGSSFRWGYFEDHQICNSFCNDNNEVPTSHF